MMLDGEDGAPWLGAFCQGFLHGCGGNIAAINIRYHRSAARASPAGISWHYRKVTSRDHEDCMLYVFQAQHRGC